MFTGRYVIQFLWGPALLLWDFAQVESFSSILKMKSGGSRGISTPVAYQNPATSASTDLRRTSFITLHSTFAADGSEYSSMEGSEGDDDDLQDSGTYSKDMGGEEDDTPTIELQPIPMSKNAGNRFVSILWDRDYHSELGPVEMHEERIKLTEDHVFYCRKTSLYNETFNNDSPVDVLWSLPMYVFTPTARPASVRTSISSLTFFSYAQLVLRSTTPDRPRHLYRIESA